MPSPHSTPGRGAALGRASATLANPSPRIGASAETTTAPEGLERRYHVPPHAAGDADIADRPEGFQADRVIGLLLAFPQETDAGNQGAARHQERERAGLRHPEAR